MVNNNNIFLKWRSYCKRYKILSEYANKIPGGLASKYDPEDFDPEALKMGIKVEMEHTDDPMVAMEIAMDHLVEDPEYYVKLQNAGL